MYYTIYKTTNLVNGKFYIGKHQTSDLNDGYLGSGKLLKEAIRKYGKDSFTKEIISFFDSEEDMNKAERVIVSEELVSDKMSYNIGVGGEGGPHFKGKEHSDEVKERIRNKRIGTTCSEETKQKIRENNARTNESRSVKCSAANKGKPKSEEHKQKIRESRYKFLEQQNSRAVVK
jgi:NUMOD3 motif